MKDIKSHLEKEVAIENFKKWFGNSQTINSEGQPITFYCGTLSEFSSFDINKTVHKSFLGRGFYLSDSYEDVNTNYSNTNGPDFIVKKSSIIDQIQSNPSEYLNNNYYNDILENGHKNTELYEIVKELFERDDNGDLLEEASNFSLFLEHTANRLLNVDNEGLIIPAYLKIENPLDIDNHYFEEEESFTGKELEQIFKFIESKGLNREVLNSLSYIMPDINVEYSLSFEEFEEACNEQLNYETDEDTFEEILEYARTIFDDSEITINYNITGSFSDFKNKFKEILEDEGLYNESENFSAIIHDEFCDNKDFIPIMSILNNEKLNMDFSDVLFDENSSDYIHFKGICSKVFERMGYDGISMLAENHFKNMKGIEGSQHFIVFNPNQIKSAIGNNGEYSLNDDDIRYRINYRMNKEHKLQNKISLKDANKIVNDIKENYPKSPEIVLISDLNSIVKNFIEKNPSILNSSGYYLPEENKVLVILKNIDGRQDFIQTIAHEIFGHMSLKDILKNDYNKTMNKIYNYYEAKGELELEKTIYQGIYNLNFNKIEDRVKIAEEKFANFVEKNGFNNFPLKNVIIGAIKNSLRTFIKDIKFNENDIIYIAQKTHNNLKKKEKNINILKKLF